MIGGIEMGHGGLVHWPQIYDWNGSQYVSANAKHPKEFRKAKADLLDKLKQFSDDPELWQYLGYAYLYKKQQRSAFAAFHKAERYYRVMLSEKDERDYALQGLGELAKITGNRREAVH
jgi:tetratricopeptide (TPR) repeat protein